jgi:DNA-binding NarL/FixJ family response regulator
MRSLIYSENKLFGQCLSHGLAAQPGVAFVRHSSHLEEIHGLAVEHRVSSVLVDLGDAAGASALTILSRSLPGMCLVAVSVDDSAADQIIACARLGCHGVVPRDASLEDVTRIVHAAERGEVTMRPAVVAQMMQALAARPLVVAATGPPDCLTRREQQICSLLCEGLTNKEIAREVNRSVGTVKNHVRSILSKLDLPRRGAIHAYLHQSAAAGTAFAAFGLMRTACHNTRGHRSAD